MAHRLLHWIHLPYLPGWRRLTAWPTPVTLRTAPMEQAESDEQAEARPHSCSASSLPQSAEHREEGESVGGGKRRQEEEITLVVGQTQHKEAIGLYKRSNERLSFLNFPNCPSYPSTPLTLFRRQIWKLTRWTKFISISHICACAISIQIHVHEYI